MQLPLHTHRNIVISQQMNPKRQHPATTQSGLRHVKHNGPDFPEEMTSWCSFQKSHLESRELTKQANKLNVKKSI